MPFTISETRRADGLHPTTTRLPTRLRPDSGSIPVQCQLDSGVIERAPGTPIEPALRRRTTPFTANPPARRTRPVPPRRNTARPALRAAPPSPISTEHCVGNRRQAAVPDDAKFVAR